MKARYFPNTDFLNATLGENPSYMWRSIMAAHDVTKQGCRRNIGTGQDTFVWKVPWLPCYQNGYITTNMPSELAQTRVSELMKIEEKAWDEDILVDLFNTRDVQLIRQIPLSNRNKQDTWMWLQEERGEFTVKSCYRLLVGEQHAPDASFWKKMWSLHLPAKIRFFLWRVCRQCLPTATALIEKRVEVSNLCCWCRMAVEDARHTLFQCTFANSVWVAMGMNQWIQPRQEESMLEHFKRLFTTGSTEQCVMIMLICWSLWNRRNHWLWNKVETSVFGTVNGALNLLSNWKAAQMEKDKYVGGQRNGVRRWQAPQQNWVKLNVDAATFRDIGTIGIGGIVRDEHGRMLRAMCKQVRGNWSPREAEALGLKEVLSWIKQVGYPRCIIETDSKLLADACNGSSGCAYFHSIVHDCIELFKHFNEVLVRFVYRSANEVANVLAKASRSMPDLQEWETVPNFLLDVVTHDLI